MFTVNIENLEDTACVAKTLSSLIEGGEVFFLQGDLGVGKTALVKCFAKSFLNNEAIVSSPTFNYFNLYESTVQAQSVFHADLYRLEHFKSLNNIGFWEYCGNSNYVSFVEWANKFDEINQIDHMQVSINFSKKERQRHIEFYSHGAPYEKILEKLKNALSDEGLKIV